MRERCLECARLLHTGEARITIALTARELVDLIYGATDPTTRYRLLQALALIDEESAKALA